MLNSCIKFRGLWTNPNLQKHVTFKELKADRCAIKAFLPELKGKRLILHDNN